MVFGQARRLIRKEFLHRPAAENHGAVGGGSIAEDHLEELQIVLRGAADPSRNRRIGVEIEIVGLGHAEGLEEQSGSEGVPGFPRHHFTDAADNLHAGSFIRQLGPGRKHDRNMGGDQVDGFLQGQGAVDLIAQFGLVKPGRHGETLTQGRVAFSGGFKNGQVLANPVIEIKIAAFGQDEHDGAGQPFGAGRDALFTGGGDTAALIGKDRNAVLPDADSDPGTIQIEVFRQLSAGRAEVVGRRSGCRGADHDQQKTRHAETVLAGGCG